MVWNILRWNKMIEEEIELMWIKNDLITQSFNHLWGLIEKDKRIQ